jgi:hypothetical protein
MVVVVCAVAAGLGLLGCSDNPQDKAAKELRSITSEAMAIAEQGWRIDDQTKEVVSAAVFAEARQRLDAAIAKAPKAGKEAAGSAYFAGGNLNLGQARCLRGKLSAYTAAPDKQVDRISQLTPEIAAAEVQLHRIERLSAVTEQDIATMTALLEGDSAKQKPGLKADLAAAEAELKDLEGQKQQRLEAKAEAERQANTIEGIAMKKLQDAALTSGEERAKLEKDAYELKLSIKEPRAKAQDAENQASILGSKITVTGSAAARLKADVARIGASIDSLANSPQRAQLMTEAEGLKKQIEGYNAEIVQFLDGLKKDMEVYSEHVGQVVKVLDDAVADYDRVGSRTLSEAAGLGVAQGNFWKGSVLAGEIAFRQYTGMRLDSIGSGLEGQAATVLTGAADAYVQSDPEKVKAVIAAYDEAIAKYGESGSSKDVMASQALTLYGKMVFADGQGDTDMARTSKQAADEICNKLKQEDPMFAASLTAKIVSGSSEFIPPMSVDLTEQYDELRKQLGSWKSLRGDAAKAKVEELLAMLDNMKPPLDPQQFTSERAAMEAALKKGFDQVDISSSDPNFR